MNFVLQRFLQMPDTLMCLLGIQPMCLIGIQPDKDDLPHFFLVVYPFLQEPRDVEEYVEVEDKLKAWRVKFKMNFDLMEAMFNAKGKDLAEQELSPMQLKDLMINVNSTFDRWKSLLK